MLDKNQINIIDQGVCQAFETFQALVSLAENFLNNHQYSIAAVCAQIASQYAVFHHPGVFTSPRLEKILLTIGQRTIQTSSLPKKWVAQEGFPRRVLHVLTWVNSIGGHTRFVWRWIQEDAQRSHSAVITQLQNIEVPPIFSETILRAGGHLHILDTDQKDPISLAQALRGIAQDVDLIALHISSDDVVPFLAFAIKDGLPPVIFIDHADHLFWIGVYISDVVVHLREAGQRLGERRRGINKNNSLLLPTPLAHIQRTVSRSKAKAQLGLTDNTILLLSIASGYKYIPLTGPGFVDVSLPIIEKYKNTVLFVIGPDYHGQWREGGEKTQGRIRAFGERSDTAAFYEAADIYIDSFPFSSITSLLEAGSYGVPLVSYCPHSQEAEMLCPGAVGLSDALIHVKSVGNFHSKLSELIENEELRLRIGEQTKSNISRAHRGDGWKQALQKMYLQISTNPLATGQLQEESRESVSDLDILVNRLYSTHSVRLGAIVDFRSRSLSYGLRLRLLFRMLSVTRGFSFGLFFPKWVEKYIEGKLGGWRRVPGVRRWLNVREEKT